MAKITALVQQADGQMGEADFEAGTRREVMGLAEANGLRVVGFRGEAPQPAPEGFFAHMMRQVPAIAGAVKGAELGASVPGPPFLRAGGAVLGAGLGAAGGEGTFAGAQRLFGLGPPDPRSIPQRMQQAGTTAMQAETGMQGLRAVGSVPGAVGSAVRAARAGRRAARVREASAAAAPVEPMPLLYDAAGQVIKRAAPDAAAAAKTALSSGNMAEIVKANFPTFEQAFQALGLMGAGAEVMGGHLLKGGVTAALTPMLTKLLFSAEGRQFLGDVFAASRDSILWQKVAPGLARTGAYLLAEGLGGEARPPAVP